MEINRGADASRNGIEKKGRSPPSKGRNSRNPEPKSAVKRGWVSGGEQRSKVLGLGDAAWSFWRVHREHWDLEFGL